MVSAFRGRCGCCCALRADGNACLLALFSQAIERGHADTSRYRYVIFLNSSVRGPFLPSYWPVSMQPGCIKAAGVSRLHSALTCLSATEVPAYAQQRQPACLHSAAH